MLSLRIIIISSIMYTIYNNTLYYEYNYIMYNVCNHMYLLYLYIYIDDQ